jgi:uncharacterized protein (DUF1786 family)
MIKPSSLAKSIKKIPEGEGDIEEVFEDGWDGCSESEKF